MIGMTAKKFFKLGNCLDKKFSHKEELIIPKRFWALIRALDSYHEFYFYIRKEQLMYLAYLLSVYA